MATRVTGIPKGLMKTIENLIHLDHDAVAAYAAAIDRLEDMAAKTQLQKFKADHERHIRELSQLCSSAGGTPPTEGDMKEYLTKGKVVIGNLKGDKGILEAMKSNEDETNQKYEKALSRDDLVAEVRTIFQRNLEDERRHREWIVGYLKKF